MKVRIIEDTEDGILYEGSVLQDCVPVSTPLKKGVEGEFCSMAGSWRVRAWEGEYEIMEEE